MRNIIEFAPGEVYEYFSEYRVEQRPVYADLQSDQYGNELSQRVLIGSEVIEHRPQGERIVPFAELRRLTEAECLDLIYD